MRADAARLPRRSLARTMARLLALYLVLSSIALWMFGRAVAAEARDRAATVAVSSTRDALRPHLTDDLMAGDPSTSTSMADVVERLAKNDHLARLKVWDESGTIVWADEAALIGERFELDAEELELFGTLDSTVAMSDLTSPENVHEATEAPEMLEVYVGFTTESGTPLLVESYFAPRFADGIHDELRSRFLPLLLGPFAMILAIHAALSVYGLRRLVHASDDREALLQRLVEASDAERRRIAAEVHDGAVQDLIGIAYSLKAAARRDDVSSDELAEMATSTESTVRSLRGLLTSIYPVSVPENGWIAGLDDLVAHLRDRGVAVTFAIDADPPAWAELLFLRTAREALRNIAKHSFATEVDIRVSVDRRGMQLEVVDNGRGFDPAAVRSGSATDGHLGLGLLHDLAEEYGASLEMESSAGAGTTLRLRVGAGAP